MAFDPVREDFQRLELRFYSALGQHDAFTRARRRSSFLSAYANRRDTLPQTDEDRAFHLVVRAADLIDYQLPFTPEDGAEALLAEASKDLDEALALDARCYDALRMKAALDYLSFEDYYRFLADGLADARACCEERAEAARSASSADPELDARLAIYPYLRWAQALANRALISGRYRIAAGTCASLIEYDPSDKADARFTYAIALAKLEDADELDALGALIGQCYPASAHNAWYTFSQAALAFRLRDMGACRRWIADLIASYPHAAQALVAQNEYPDALFARTPFEPYTENELLVALSEATVLWQEGLEESIMGFLRIDPEDYDRMHHTGTFGTWLENDPEIKAAAAADVRSPFELFAQRLQNRADQMGDE